ncbi:MULTISPECIES: transposase [Trichocoleus]|uniref:Transposase n=1 Tax=Trichocoleus desertorum GB2-A4 TaxID=2933944 RepID=A0ABV0JFY6_9CYAN|nr:transposase [Trichocoleus sp. FACHB-46]MBD1863042.1 transposase [Trichocoleus sp. FACHB-46]
MYKLTSDLFREAAERFAVIEPGLLTHWPSKCKCPEPGIRFECQTCPYYKKLGQLVQQQIDPVGELGLATIRPVKHADPYTDQVKQQCIAMYQLGYSVNEIQELNGIPLRRTLRNWLRTSGLPGRSADFSEKEKQICIQLYLDGWTPREIEDQTDVSADTITDLVHAEGIARETRYPEAVKQQSLELYKEGKTAAQVAEITGVHPVTIYSWIAEAGLGGKQKRYSKATIDKCLRLYREGKSPKEISALTKVKAGTIRYWITKAGLIKVEDGDQVKVVTLLPPDPSQPVTRQSYERRPVGYWENFDNLKRELIALNEIRGQIGVMPTAQELQQMKRCDLQKAVSEFHGGYAAVAEKLGLIYGKKTYGYWLEFSNLEHELVAFIEHHGTPGVMPTKEEIQAVEPSLSWAIGQHGGFLQVAQRLNLKLSYSRKPRGYWRNLDNMKREILEVVEQLGQIEKTMPTHEELTRIGRKDLINAIASNGGWASVGKRIGLPYVRNYPNPNDY